MLDKTPTSQPPAQDTPPGLSPTNLAGPRGPSAPGADDCGLARTMGREVIDDDARGLPSAYVAGPLSDGVSEVVLTRAFDYWKKIDQGVGERIEQAVGTTVGA